MRAARTGGPRTAEQSVEVIGDRYQTIRNEQARRPSDPSAVLPELGTPRLPAMENGQLIGGPTLNLRTPAVPIAPDPAPSGQPEPPASPSSR